MRERFPQPVLKERIDLEILRSEWSDFLFQVIVPTEKVYKIRNGKKVISERNIRSMKLNKTKKQIKEPICGYVLTFKSSKVEHKFDNPFMQAEYAYSLIESEV